MTNLKLPNVKLLCVSLFVFAVLASSFLGSAASPHQLAVLEVADLLH